MLLECDQPFILDKKVNLLNMNRQQLYDFFTLLGEKHFRADQVMKWIYHHYCDDFDNMTNIQQSLRERLKQYAEIRVPIVSDRYCSSDGTIKWCFQIGNQQIETVYIPQKMRATLCISSQIGCLLRCTFCATGQQGFSRNLYVFEIIGQIWCVSKIIKNIGRSVVNFPPITNIVMMGMGEPLLNFNNIVTSIEIMLDDFGFGFSRKRIILSTAGIVPAINKLADRVDVSLAVSLHAPNDLIRSKIMPINKKWNIASLIASIKYYLSKSRINGKYVTIEYVMLDHVNDFISCAYQLVECLKNIPCKINIIPWNSVSCSIYSCSSKKRIDHFVRILLQYGLVTTVRVARGNDINAACGQLVGMVINKRKDIV